MTSFWSSAITSLVLVALLCGEGRFVAHQNAFVAERRSPDRAVPKTAKRCDVPIQVLSYQILDRGFEYEISNLVLSNCSSRAVKEVEFSWIVATKEDDQIVTRKGLQFSREFPNTLKSGARIRLPFSVVSVNKILLGESRQRGASLHVVVENVIFADGTRWKPYRNSL
jgi:hypothetical protein